MVTKSPIEQARELISELVRFIEQQPTLPAEVQLEFIADLFARIVVSQQELTTYAESLERQLKIPKCRKCNDTGKLHGCQRQGKHGLEYYSKDCDCKTGE